MKPVPCGLKNKQRIDLLRETRSMCYILITSPIYVNKIRAYIDILYVLLIFQYQIYLFCTIKWLCHPY